MPPESQRQVPERFAPFTLTVGRRTVGVVDHGMEVRYRSAGADLCATSWGEGQPIILLHGSGLATHAVFSGLATRLEGTYRVVACDVRGFGKSLSADSKDHTWRQYADDVIALMDHLGMHTAIVGGYSFGAGIALATALRHEDRMEALILAEPAYAGSEIGQTGPQRAVWARGRAFFEHARIYGLEPCLLDTVTLDEDRERLRRALQEQNEPSFLAAHEGELATAQPFPRLAALRVIIVPTLLVFGSDDGHDPQIARWYAEHLPVVSCVSIGTSEPSGWAGAIQTFLEGLPRDPPGRSI